MENERPSVRGRWFTHRPREHVAGDPVEEDAFRRVLAALVRVDRRIARRSVSLDTSIVDDLGLDSLRFVDLAVALEDAFGIREFPLQDWYDTESKRTAHRCTVASLVALCVEVARSSKEY